MITPDDGEIYTVQPNLRTMAEREAALVDGVMVEIVFHGGAERIRSLSG